MFRFFGLWVLIVISKAHLDKWILNGPSFKNSKWWGLSVIDIIQILDLILISILIFDCTFVGKWISKTNYFVILFILFINSSCEAKDSQKSKLNHCTSQEPGNEKKPKKGISVLDMKTQCVSSGVVSIADFPTLGGSRHTG